MYEYTKDDGESMYVVARTEHDIIGAVTGLDLAPGEGVAILAAEKGLPDLEKVVAGLRDFDRPFFGAMLPGLIDGRRKYEEGILLLPLPMKGEPMLIGGLARRDFALPPLPVPEMVARGARCTVFMFVDYLSANIDFLLSRLFNQLGNAVSYLGGGAGSMDLKQRPCVFTREGVYQDAAVLAFLECESHLGVRHGWHPLGGPFVATKTEGNTILELNWRNAFEVYREALDREAGFALTRKNFFPATMAHPFGLIREGAEFIVRDPILVGERGELICVGEVPENAVLTILEGDREALIQAAGQASTLCKGDTDRVHRLTLVMDCISRVMYLQDDFDKELEAICGGDGGKGTAFAGALTLGEISSHGERYLEFLNKTVVVAGLYE